VKLTPLVWLLALEVLLTLLGGLWMWLAGYPFATNPSLLTSVFWAVAGYIALLALEDLTGLFAPAGYDELDRLMRSLGRALRQSGLSYTAAVALALASAVGEETLFRGALFNFFRDHLNTYWALLLQAALFAAGHPAPGRAGRLYAVWALLAGLVFGGLYLASGSLLPGILAHFLYNAKGFYEMYE